MASSWVRETRMATEFHIIKDSGRDRGKRVGDPIETQSAALKELDRVRKENRRSRYRLFERWK